MNPLAEIWDRSGRRHQLLYQGSTEDVITELKAWVKRRRVYNDFFLEESWVALRAMDSLQQFADRPGGFQQGQAPGMMDQVAAIAASQMNNLNRTQSLQKEKDRENLLANFLLTSLQHRGVRWPPIPCTKRCQVDADVCGLLGTVDQSFNSEMELEILEDRKRITKWRNERFRRDIARPQDMAKNPAPGVNTHTIGPVATRSRQAIANDPTISATRALKDTADDILDPSLLRNLENTTVYIADMLGNIKVAGDENKPTTEDSSSSVAADTPLNIDNAAATSFNTSDNTKKDIGPSSSTVTENGAKDQSLPGVKGPDDASKMSKAKKKREARKRAKARAKEAADAEDPAGNHDDEGGSTRPCG